MVNDFRLPQLNEFSLDALADWIDALTASLPAAHRKLVQNYLTDLSTKLERIRRLGLGYLTCSRPFPPFPAENCSG